MKRNILSLVLLAWIGFLIYSNTLHVPFYLDDHPNIRENKQIQIEELTPQALVNAAFRSKSAQRPVANLSFALNHYFHRLNLPGYHMVNILIHIVAAYVLYLLMKVTLLLRCGQVGGFGNSQTTGSDNFLPRLPKTNEPFPVSVSTVALLGALLWLVHPLHTQSVTYLVQRMTSMASMFYVISLFAYVKGRLTGANKTRFWWYALCGLAGMLSIGSKQMAATLPLMVFLYEWYFFQGLSRKWLLRRVKLIAFLVIMLALLGYLFLGADPITRVLSGYARRDFTLAERLLTQPAVIMKYVLLLLYPHPSLLNLDHYMPLSRSLMQPPHTVFFIMALLALFVTSVLSARRHKLASFALGWFLINLAIESSVIPLEIIFEHRTYLPSMFLSGAAVYYFTVLSKNKIVVFAVTVPLLALFSLWTYQRNMVWTDPIHFWEDSALKAGQKARPYNNLALALANTGRLNEALAHFGKAIQLEPTYYKARYNMADALFRLDRLDEAFEHYKAAVELKPSRWETNYGFGKVLLRKGDPDGAIPYLMEASRKSPEKGEIYTDLGMAFSQKNDYEASARYLAKVIELEPDSSTAHYNLGVSYLKLQNENGALESFRRALAVDPANAQVHYSLGNLYSNGGELGPAVEHFRMALNLQPDFPMAHNNLGAVYARQGKMRLAVRHFEEAVSLDPGNADARENLAQAQAMLE